MTPVVPFEIEDGIEQLDPDGRQLDESWLIVLPVEFVKLNVICLPPALPPQNQAQPTTPRR
jgi:hypothetical protein